MDPSYHRRSQMEDEFMLFVFPTMEGREKKPMHTSSLTGAAYVQEILTGHESLCKRHFRMEAYIFHALVEKLRENQILEDSTIVSLEEKVAIFLYAVAKNASNETLQDRFQHSGQTISRHFGDVLDAVTKLTSIYIRPPSLRPHPVLRRSRFHPYFNDCIGAIDGTHIPMTIPPHEQEPYRNRKQTITQNVMVACDFDLRFVHVHPGWEGSASDARVLQDALNHGFQVPHGKYYLVDAGYANTPQFLVPYRGTRYHLQEQAQARQRPQNRKELFNLRHAQLRNHIERIIGIVKKRFPVLKVATRYSPGKQVDISMACFVLHNFIQLHDGDASWLNDDTPDIDPHLIVDVPTGYENYTSDVGAFNNTREAGNHLRDYIADKLWEDYIARRA